jgi:hypothetical protein
MTPANGGATRLGRAIERCDWERAALYALLAVARAMRERPDATLDDLLAVLTSKDAFAEERDGRREA